MKLKNYFKIYPLQLLFFTIAFIVVTPIGTVSHELGHVVAAQIMGYETKLSYSSTYWNAEKINQELEILYLENEQDIIDKKHFRDKPRFDYLISKFKTDSIINTSGGPIQTMLTGTIGLIFLYFRRKNTQAKNFKWIDWLGVFLSLFWLRETFNLFSSVSRKIFGSGTTFFGGDEARISIMLNLPPGLIPVICGLVGLVISLYVIFRIIPAEKRFTFILSGLLGGSVGLYLWMNILGPSLLP